MAKKISTKFKLMIQAGKANPSPPVGPALGQRGVNIMEFCKNFNDKTKDLVGFKIPVEITVYIDKSFTFITKEPPVTELLKKVLNIKKGSDNPLKNKIGTITTEQINKIVDRKIIDFNTNDKDQAKLIVLGSCRSMGIELED